MRTKLTLAITLSSFIILHLCGCYGGEDCSGPYDVYCSYDKLVGTTTLEPNKGYFIPYLQKDSLVIFKNNVSSSDIIFKTSERKIYREKNYLYHVFEPKECMPNCNYWLYADFQRDDIYLSYENFNIRISRLKKIQTGLSNYSNYDFIQRPDYLSVYIGDEQFYILPNYPTPAEDQYEKLDSLTLGAHTYYNVYRGYKTDNSFVTDVYYTTADGLIGYSFANGEKWYLK